MKHLRNMNSGLHQECISFAAAAMTVDLAAGGKPLIIQPQVCDFRTKSTVVPSASLVRPEA